MSSMAAHSSPRGFSPAAANASGRTRRSSLPMPSSPSASASRRAGSTVSTSTRPPRCSGGHRRQRRRRRGLAHPARPAGDHDLLGRQQLLERGRRCAISSSSSASASATCIDRPLAVAAGEQLGHEHDAEARPEAVLQHGQVPGPLAAERHRQRGRVEHRRRRRPPARTRPPSASGSRRPPGVRRAANTSSSPRVNSSGSTRLTTTAASATGTVAPRRVDQLDASRSTGISSAVVTTTTPVWAGSARMSIIHRVWSRTSPTCTRSLIVHGAESWPAMWPDAAASTTTRS